MATDIVTNNKDPISGLMEYYASILSNFKCRMSLNEAESYYKFSHGELKAAIEAGKCKAYPCGSRYKVSHAFVAEYIETYCTYQATPLPS